MKTQTYLDYNATCPIRPSVVDAVTDAMAVSGNPSSVHRAGRAARALVENSRVKVASLVGARTRDVMFCGGGTEAANTVILGAPVKSLIISPTEHDCVRAAVTSSVLPVQWLSVDRRGVICLKSLEKLLVEAAKPALISVMAANNETGTLQPVTEICKLANHYGALVHTDAVQMAGKMSIDVTRFGTDYLTLSAHKIGGPQGVGAVVLAPSAGLKPLLVGGGQEIGRRSGTENVAGIAGFGAAALDALSSLSKMTEIQALRDDMEARLKDYAKELVIVGEGAQRLGNTSCLAIPDLPGETQVMHFDLAGICVSSGSACSSGKVKLSHVLGAMGLPENIASSSIRVSLGYGTTPDHIDTFIAAWKVLYDRTKKR